MLACICFVYLARLVVRVRGAHSQGGPLTPCTSYLYFVCVLGRRINDAGFLLTSSYLVIPLNESAPSIVAMKFLHQM